MIYRLEELIMDDDIIAFLNLFKVLFIVIVIGHIVGCLFYAIGEACYTSNVLLENSGRSWLVN
jgi:hypothetical protein